jgi:hypothetical protein
LYRILVETPEGEEVIRGHGYGYNVDIEVLVSDIGY